MDVLIFLVFIHSDEGSTLETVHNNIGNLTFSLSSYLRYRVSLVGKVNDEVEGGN